MSTSPDPLTVLVVDSHGQGGARGAAELLIHAGHTVHHCHEAAHASFPCNALTPVGCPLDRHDVDVAVVVREHPLPRPTFLEHGATCALRHGVPLVVTGRTVLSPYDPWASGTTDDGDELTEVCHQAASPTLTSAATTAAADVLARHGLQTPSVTAIATSRSRSSARIGSIVESPDWPRYGSPPPCVLRRHTHPPST